MKSYDFLKTRKIQIYVCAISRGSDVFQNIFLDKISAVLEICDELRNLTNKEIRDIVDAYVGRNNYFVTIFDKKWEEWDLRPPYERKAKDFVDFLRELEEKGELVYIRDELGCPVAVENIGKPECADEVFVVLKDFKQAKLI